jgi:hypothetical protein
VLAIPVLTLILALAPAKHAPDLNAPIDTRPTIASEINRGNRAAFDCSLQNVSEAPSFSECVSDAISSDQQKQTNSLPFMVGAYWGECSSEALMVKSDSKLAPTNSVAAASLPDAERQLALSYPVFRHYQEKLGVTDEQLIEAIDDLTPTGKQMLLAQLHAWEKDPPPAPPGSP